MKKKFTTSVGIIVLIIILSLLAGCNSGTAGMDSPSKNQTGSQTDIQIGNQTGNQMGNQIDNNVNSPLPCPTATSLGWDPPTTYPDMTTALSDSDITGYHIYYSTVSGNYSNADRISVGDMTSYAISDIPLITGNTTTYFFVITASTGSSESGYSNEACIVVP